MVPNWKLTATYIRSRGVWDVRIWLNEDRDAEPLRWRCICAMEAASFEDKFTTEQRIRIILRQLGTNPPPDRVAAVATAVMDTIPLFGE